MEGDKCCAGEIALTDVKESAEELVEQAAEVLPRCDGKVQDTPQGD